MNISIEFAAKLEEKLDTVLFAQNDERWYNHRGRVPNEAINSDTDDLLDQHGGYAVNPKTLARNTAIVGGAAGAGIGANALRKRYGADQIQGGIGKQAKAVAGGLRTEAEGALDAGRNAMINKADRAKRVVNASIGTRGARLRTASRAGTSVGNLIAKAKRFL